MTQDPDNPNRMTGTIELRTDDGQETWEFTLTPADLSDDELLAEMETFVEAVEAAYSNEFALESSVILGLDLQQAKYTAELARRTLGDTDD